MKKILIASTIAFPCVAHASMRFEPYYPHMTSKSSYEGQGEVACSAEVLEKTIKDLPGDYRCTLIMGDGLAICGKPGADPDADSVFIDWPGNPTAWIAMLQGQDIHVKRIFSGENMPNKAAISYWLGETGARRAEALCAQLKAKSGTVPYCGVDYVNPGKPERYAIPPGDRRWMEKAPGVAPGSSLPEYQKK